MTWPKKVIGIAVSALVVVYVILLKSFTSFQIEKSYPLFRHFNQFRKFESIPFTLDSSGQYKVFRSFFRRSQLFGPEGTIFSLVTHTTLEHLYLLPKLVQRWQGPISLSVFVEAGQIGKFMREARHLQECYGEVGLLVDFHVVTIFGVDDGIPGDSLVWEFGDFFSEMDRATPCTENENLESSPRPENYAHAVPYPNNLLRNAGRRFSGAEYILVVDIDMLPNIGLYGTFVNYIKNKNGGSHYLASPSTEVYVVPAFEMNSAEAIPHTKTELLKLLNHFVVRPFYFEVCWKCQQPTDYQTWQNIPPADALNIAYHIEWRDPWEPFFIAHRTAPFFDERFKQYGFNRISHACEMHVAGYQFSILNNAFLVHQGFKTRKVFHPTKQEEQNKNRALFGIFKKELQDAYPNSVKSCS